MASRRENSPFKVTTGRTIFNRVIAALLALAAICGICFFLYMHREGIPDEPAEETPIEEPQEFDGENGTEPSMTDAAAMITAYYRALSERNAVQLRYDGFEDAANALEQGWLEDIGFNVVLPDISADALPESCGTYAGNTLYRLSDVCHGDGVYSDILGKIGYEGWFYYDVAMSSWTLVDPTIPSSIQAPDSNNVTRSSVDGVVTTNVTARGAYCNPWWAFIREHIGINANGTSAVVARRPFDGGVMVVDNGRFDSGSVSGEVSGDVDIYRGQLSGFVIDRIGSADQSLQGDVFPYTIIYGDEDCSPVFSVGTYSNAEVALG